MKTFDELENELFESGNKDKYRLAKAATLWHLKNRDEATTSIYDVAVWFRENGYRVEPFVLGWSIER